MLMLLADLLPLMQRCRLPPNLLTLRTNSNDRAFRL